MIVKMKKITLLVLEKQRADALEGLRKLGIVHVKNIRTPSSENLRLTDEIISLMEDALGLLKAHKPKGVTKRIRWKPHETAEKVREIAHIAREQDALLKDLQDTESELLWYKPWGGFDPNDIKRFAKDGLFIKLYRANAKETTQLRQRKDIKIINSDKHYVYFSHLSADEKAKLNYERVKLPSESFSSLCVKKESIHKRLGEIEATYRLYAPATAYMEEHLKELDKRHNFLSVMHGMKEEGKFSYLQGFAPARNADSIKAFCKKEAIGYLLEEPDKPEEVPTLIQNPKWIDIIRPVFTFMSTVPGYKEYDISLIFLLFFSLFFAMLIGDAGYGLLFLITTFLVRRKFNKAPPQPFFLMYALSFATVCWGAVTGTWFGVESIARLPFFNSLVIEQISSFADNSQNFMIYICFTIGIIHLTIAHLMLILRIINSLKALAEAGWIMVLWGLYFLAGTLVLSRPFPQFALYLIIVGSCLLILFTNFQKNILKGIAKSLTDIPLKIISSFGDIVSYIRLFAVGYATVVLATTFNSMAAGLGFNNIISGLGASIILLLGHGLNIILGFMAVIVHGVRLNMLEFSGQMGMEWSGKEYSPFKE